MSDAFTTFDTPVGPCSIGWNENGVSAVGLLRASLPGTQAEPPPMVRSAIDGIVATLRGESPDLSAIELDMRNVPEFHQRVFDVARTIAPGTTMTYGQIATRLGDPTSSRAVGYALGHNPFPIVVPCHRVVGAGDKLVGFSAPGGLATKLRLLAIEGAMLDLQPTES